METLNHPLSNVAYTDWQEIYEPNILSENSHLKVKQIRELSLENEPFRLEEKRYYDELIANTKIRRSPVFVIGHWRSGTTHLQNILTQDERYGYLNVTQSLNPHAFLMREVEDCMNFKESKRFMDNVKLTGEAPSEEEVAMGILAKGSFWHGYYLTDKMDYYFDKYTLFNNIDADEMENWKSSYLYLLKKLTYKYDGKPLFLKNPPNTCRLKLLLEMFPNAKFIHIRRNPYLVYFSRMRQYDSAIKFKSLQNITKRDWEQKVFLYYKAMMDKHFEERSLIPESQYVEILFEDLKASPVSELKKVYDHLGLLDFDQTQYAFESYLSSLKDYKQNSYDFDSDKLDEIYEHWNTTIDMWAYERPN